MGILEKIRNIWKTPENIILSGEQPLVLFISSVMTDDLSPVRKNIVKNVNRNKGFIPWAFEFTPASSEDVEEGYLRKVRESDFVIWLAGKSTTKPVEKEIREALFHNKRILVFKLPIDQQRDEETIELIDEVGERAKWIEIPNMSTLPDELDLSLSDEIIRAVRLRPELSRIATFNELLSSSRARCIARWQAAGVTLEKSFELYEDSSIGMPSPEVLSSLQEKNIIVLTGDFGSGKSLMAERFLQETIKKSINNSKSPIPIYIKAQKIKKNLSEQIFCSAQGLGNPKRKGAVIVIDGADEAGLNCSAVENPDIAIRE